MVTLVARSDDSALAELYDRYDLVAYGLALRVVRDKALAEDAGRLADGRGGARGVEPRSSARRESL